MPSILIAGGLRCLINTRRRYPKVVAAVEAQLKLSHTCFRAPRAILSCEDSRTEGADSSTCCSKRWSLFLEAVKTQ